MAESQTAGAIYDLGYQRYTGERRGRGYAFRTLLNFSFRSAFGIGRGEKAKSLPVLVAAVVYLPAMIQIGVASSSGMSQFLSYANQLQFTAFLLALFAAAQAPELIVTDRQQGILSLYLSRPLRAMDYALAKLVALTGAMLVLTLGPQLMMFLGRIFISDKPWPTFVAEWPKLMPIFGGTILVSLFFAAIGLGLSSLASRRGYATAGVIAFFLLTAAMSEMIRAVAFGNLKRYAVLANPSLLITGLTNWLFEIEALRRSGVGRADLPGTLYLYVMLTVTALATGLLLNRYRRGDA
jgi:ABC-2 type transport system permease protein